MVFLPLPVLALTAALAGAAKSDGNSPDRQVGGAPTCPQSGETTASFSSALTASSFRTGDGRVVQLAGVIGPGEAGDKSDPDELARARATLASFLSGHKVSVTAVGVPDRYERLPAEVFADDVWVQDKMVRMGLLRVLPERQTDPCIPQMLSAENDAIRTKAGHWGDGQYRVRTPDQVTRSAAQFEVVEGEIWRARLDRGREVIEFTNASSFRVTLSPQVVRSLRENRTDFRRLRGRMLRVHGWLDANDPPMMEISTPEAVQVFTRAARPR